VNARAAQAHELEARRDAALRRLAEAIPFAGTLGVSFERLGDELTAKLAFDDKLIGNPTLPALHGGATGAFLEITAQVALAWSVVRDRLDGGGDGAEAIERGEFPPLPKTIDFTLDYMRAGRPMDSYARAVVARAGRRYASVRVEAWQEERARPFLSAIGHFLMPRDEG
jgi:acyl-coenzyme A thioesterase PaaI-like protein